MSNASFERFRQRGQEVLTLERALSQDIRELHIGLLNMMPDAALQVTEQQFMRLVGNSNQIAQFFVHPFSIPGLPRSQEAEAYIDKYYTDFEKLQEAGLDALIIVNEINSRPVTATAMLAAPSYAVSVPEPTALAMALAGSVLLLTCHGCRQRRRRG